MSTYQLDLLVDHKLNNLEALNGNVLAVSADHVEHTTDALRHQVTYVRINSLARLGTLGSLGWDTGTWFTKILSSVITDPRKRWRVSIMRPFRGLSFKICIRRS